MKDQEVLKRLKKGDYSVFKYLYKYYGKIENHVLKNSGTEDDARDLFQNALIVFYKKSMEPDFELTAQISTYLFSIVKNSWLKKITRNKELTGTDIPEQASENTEGIEFDPSPSETQSDLTVGGYLQNLLKKVGDPCKSLIVMFHFDQLSWDEIALKLNYKTAHAARNQKYKCFLKIRKLIPNSDREQLLNVLNQG